MRKYVGILSCRLLKTKRQERNPASAIQDLGFTAVGKVFFFSDIYQEDHKCKKKKKVSFDRWNKV